MVYKRPRPNGFDYQVPDLPELRCLICNRDGMNRTGLFPIAYMGASTTGCWAIKCVCNNGLKNLTSRSRRPDSRDDCAWYGGDCGSGEKCSDECYEPSGS